MFHSQHTHTQLPPVVVRASSDIIKTRLQALGELAGIHIHLAPHTDSTANGVLFFDEEYGTKTPCVKASFHPSYAAHFTEGTLVLDVDDDAGDILELMIAAGATNRGTVIGVLGSHGGAGTTTLACALSNALSKAHSMHSFAVMDCDPLSAGITHWCATQTPGITWADLREDTGTLVPGPLAKALPARKNLHVLSADENAGMPTGGQLPTRAVAALSQSHDMTILDISRSLIADGTDLLTWCDILILVTDTSPHAVSHARRTVRSIENSTTNVPLILAVNRVSSGAQAASIAYDIGIETATPVRHARTLAKDLEHGMSLADRPRSHMHKDVARLCTLLEKVLS